MSPVYFLFFVSGFSALVYEMLWFRHLGFIFGNTVYAATTVVSAFMTGLGIGAWYAGRRAATLKRPVRTFGLLELGIGAYALAMPFLFHGVRLAYRAMYLQAGDSMALTPLRFVMAFAVMLVPTICMGATLPILSQALLRRYEDFGRKLGWLYGLNTLGAASGVLAAGYVLIPGLGLTGASLVAVAGNVLIALVAMFWGEKWAPTPSDAEAGEGTGARARHWPLFAAMAMAGFVALAFEVLWFRTLILVFGSTTYSFCAMLAVYLAGIAIGPLLFGAVVDRVKSGMLLFAALELGIAAYAIFSMRLFNGQAEFLLQWLVDRGFTWPSLVSAQFLIALKFMLVPTLCMGLAFAAAVKVLRAALAESSRAVAAMYAWNTAGCVAGTLAAGFWLLPAFGLERSLTLMAAVTALFGAVLAIRAGGGVMRRAAGAAAGLALAAVALVHPPEWDRQLLAAGPYFSPWNFVTDGRVTLRERLASERLLFYKEGVTATASATATDDGDLYFSMDGKVEADTSPRGMVVQRMIGHLPMLFHPNPKVVMNLGYGAGVTFGALGCYPVDHLEVVEIEPAVTNIVNIWAEHNDGIGARQDKIVTINDGRNHLFCTPIKYDVITSDPFEPVVSGASHLFTVEHFAQAKDKLADGGIMGQWVPMYEMSERDFLTILRSFVHVFPRSAIFFTGGDTMMLGFTGEMKLDAEAVRAKFAIPAVSNSLAGVGFTKPEMILGMLVAEMGRGADFVGEGPLNTDGHPLIEFSVPKSAVKYTVDQNQRVLLDNFTEIPQAFLDVFDKDRQVVLKDQHEALRLALQANLMRAEGDEVGAFNLLGKAHEIAPDNPVIINELSAGATSLATALMNGDQLQQASQLFQYALTINPAEFSAIVNLVSLAMMANNAPYAGQVLDQGLAIYPDSASLLALKGKWFATIGNPNAAVPLYERAVELLPWRPELWSDFSYLQHVLGNNGLAERYREQAERAYRRWE
jgi:spermidine synthase